MVSDVDSASVLIKTPLLWTFVPHSQVSISSLEISLFSLYRFTTLSCVMFGELPSLKRISSLYFCLSDLTDISFPASVFSVVLRKGRKLNGAASSPTPPRGALLSICSLPSKCWQFGPFTDSKLAFPEGNESPNSHHMKINKNASSLQNFYIMGRAKTVAEGENLVGTAVFFVRR